MRLEKRTMASASPDLSPYELRDDRQKALKEMSPLLSLFYFRKTAGNGKGDEEKKGSKMGIAGTMLRWIRKNNGALTIMENRCGCTSVEA